MKKLLSLLMLLCLCMALFACKPKEKGDLLAFAHTNGTFAAAFTKKEINYRATVCINESEDTVTVCFAEPQTLSGVTVQKTRDGVTAHIGQMPFSGAEALLAPFSVLFAKDPVLLSAESEGDVRKLTVRCEKADYTLTFKDGDLPLSVEGGGFTLYLSEVAS